jgi:hypothetical protein
MPNHDFTLTSAALYALLASTDSEMRMIMSALEQIGREEPVSRGIAAIDQRGRPLVIRAVGKFVILYHARAGGALPYIVDIRHG